MTLTPAEQDALVLRANRAGHASVADYCAVIETALRAVGQAPDAGPWAAFARLALAGAATALEP